MPTSVELLSISQESIQNAREIASETRRAQQLDNDHVSQVVDAYKDTVARTEDIVDAVIYDAQGRVDQTYAMVGSLFSVIA